MAVDGPSTASLGRLRRYRSLDPTTWLLALDDGEPVGLGGAIDYGTFAYIGLVGVLQDIQRRGIGHAIMARLLALIDARGGRTSLLDAMDTGAALYRKMGFVDDDTVRLFHGEARGIPTAMARARTPLRHRCSSGEGSRSRASSCTCDSASPFPRRRDRIYGQASMAAG